MGKRTMETQGIGQTGGQMNNGEVIPESVSVDRYRILKAAATFIQIGKSRNVLSVHVFTRFKRV